MNDRIKLAEAMWPDKKWCTGYPLGFIDENNVKHHRAPDPENDANDDYLVLEWIRSPESQVMLPIYAMKLGELLRDRGDTNALHNYQIGDYARACLKVLNNE